jgi:hypothetical protein
MSGFIHLYRPISLGTRCRADRVFLILSCQVLARYKDKYKYNNGVWGSIENAGKLLKGKCTSTQSMAGMPSVLGRIDAGRMQVLYNESMSNPTLFMQCAKAAPDPCPYSAAS